MTDIDAKLEEARGRAENYGNLRGLKDTADDYLKGVYAQQYQDISDLMPGATVAAMDAAIRNTEAYHDAIDQKKKRYALWTTAEIYMKILFAEVEKYRTDKATDRTMIAQHK